MYKKHSTRPTKIPDLKTPAEQILSSPRKNTRNDKKQRLPGQDKSITSSKPQMPPQTLQKPTAELKSPYLPAYTDI